MIELRILPWLNFPKNPGFGHVSAETEYGKGLNRVDLIKTAEIDRNPGLSVCFHAVEILVLLPTGSGICGLREGRQNDVVHSGLTETPMPRR